MCRRIDCRNKPTTKLSKPSVWVAARRSGRSPYHWEYFPVRIDASHERASFCRGPRPQRIEKYPTFTTMACPSGDRTQSVKVLMSAGGFARV